MVISFGFDIENDYIAGFDRGSWEEILMATNDFKPFATGSGANVLSQADYEALSALASGFFSGKASSARVNKALSRQSSTIAAVLGNSWRITGSDVPDNGEHLPRY